MWIDALSARPGIADGGREVHKILEMHVERIFTSPIGVATSPRVRRCRRGDAKSYVARSTRQRT